MGAQFGERHDRIDRRTVLDDVEIVGRKVHNTSAVIARDIRIPDVPFGRHGPIQNRSSRWNLINLQRDIAPKYFERPPYAVAGNAAANWKKLFDQSHHRVPIHVEGWFAPVDWRIPMSHVSSSRQWRLVGVNMPASTSAMDRCCEIRS